MTFASHVQPCGCRGVPATQHLPGCPTGRGSATVALRCSACGFRTATLPGHRCGLCGGQKEATHAEASPSSPFADPEEAHSAE